MERIKIKRYYVSFFNATYEIVENISLPKVKGDGCYPVIFSGFALNSTTGFAEGIIEFEDQIWSNALQEYFVQHDAACITVLTFQHNDHNQSAGTALSRVWKTAKGPGFDLITRGECNAKLLAKAKEIMAEDEKAKAAEHAFDAKTQAALKVSLDELKENMVTKGDLARVGEALATKDDLSKIDETVDEMSLKMATKEDLTGMATKEDLNSMVTKEDLSKVEGFMITKEDLSNMATKFDLSKVGETLVTKDDLSKVGDNLATKDDLALTQDELKRMRERAEHAEHLSFVLRGQLGAEDSKKVRSLRKEVEVGKKENEKLKRQMVDRDRMEAEKDQKMQERLNDISAGVERMEKRLKFMEERDSLREERESRLLEILGRMEEELDALSTRDFAVRM